MSSVTGIGLPALAFAFYVGSLLLLATAAWLIAARLYRTSWAALALLAALTLRHSISRTGTNTLEGYFHPRQLAFALGALALRWFFVGGCCQQRSPYLVAAAVHPTTAMWFAIWLTVAVAVSERRWRLPIAAAVVIGGLAAAWAVIAGPLAGRLAVMDAEWLATLDTKDYLFPLEWPLATWLFNLAYLPVIVGCIAGDARAACGRGRIGRRDRRTGTRRRLLVVLPLNAAHVALAVQLQASRLFWMLDFLAVIYLVWAMAEGPVGGDETRAATASRLVVRCPPRVADTSSSSNSRSGRSRRSHSGQRLGPCDGVGQYDRRAVAVARGPDSRRALRHEPAGCRRA